MSYCVTEGNAVADATLRQTSEGKQVANVVVRVDQRVRTGDGGFSGGPTIDYEITVWGKAAETFARTATRGARIFAPASSPWRNTTPATAAPGFAMESPLTTTASPAASHPR